LHNESFEKHNYFSLCVSHNIGPKTKIWHLKLATLCVCPQGGQGAGGVNGGGGAALVHLHEPQTARQQGDNNDLQMPLLKRQCCQLFLYLEQRNKANKK
jgi:hypothetical protein